MRRAAPLVAALLVAASCYGSNGNLTESGKGLPELSIDFPESSAPGTTQVAVLTVTNPGPEQMSSLVVAFARVGPLQGGGELPTPIVDGAAKGVNPAVVDVSPEPNEISRAAVEFFFDGLAEGKSAEITFELKVPAARGEAANSVTVYDGAEPARAAGARLQTIVEL
jgi:hypothetical protein